MTKAAVRLYLNSNVVGETTIETVDPDGSDVPVTDELIDDWASEFTLGSLTLKGLNVEAWDTVTFDVDGTVYTRNYINT